MAKIKRWVIYVIISAILGLSLIGLAVGLYYCFKPEPNNPNGPMVYPLSPEQQKFVETLNGNKVNIGSSYYSGVVYADGSPVDINSIDQIIGNIAIIKNGLGVPEFYTFKEEDFTSSNNYNQRNITKSNDTIFGNVLSENNKQIVFTKINIKENYTYIAENSEGELYLTPSFVIVKNNASEYFLVSLKTGETIMDASKYFTTSTDDSTYMSSGEIVSMDGNWLVVTEREQRLEGTTAKLTKTTKVINLLDASISKDFVYAVEAEMPDDPDNAVSDFTYSPNHSSEQYVYSKVDSGYLILVTTKFTYVYAPNLIDGNMAEAISPMANTFTLAENTSNTLADTDTSLDEESQEVFGVTIEGQKYSQIEYYTAKYLPNNTFLVEKNLIKERFTDTDTQAIGADAIFTEYNSLSSYTVYSITEGGYVDSGDLQTNCKIRVIDSNVDGFMLVLEDRMGLNITPAVYYDYNFNKIISYDYGYSGKVVEYNSKDGFFVTNSSNSSSLIDIKGVNRVSFPGYKVYSKTTTNGFIILKNDDNYILYNTTENKYYNYNFSMVTQITDGKLIGYKTGDCFYLVDLVLGTIDPMPYIDPQSVNTLIASLGYYVELIDGKYYLTTTNGQLEKIEIERIDYNTDIKILGGKVYTRIKTLDGTSVIVSDYTCEFGTYSSQELQQNFVVNKDYFKNNSASTTAYILDPDYHFGIDITNPPIDTDEIYRGEYRAEDFDKQFSFEAPQDNVTGDGRIEITPTFSFGVKSNKSVPSYSINISYAKIMATNKAHFTSSDRDIDNYGVGYKNYGLLEFDAVKRDFPVKEDALLEKSNNGAEYRFNSNCYVCASKYYTPYGTIYIIRLQGFHGYDVVGVSKDFVVLELDKSTYVDGTMTYSEYDGYNINRKTTRQFIPLGTSANVNSTAEEYKKLNKSMFIGGITSGGFSSNEVKSQITTSARLLTEANKNLLKDDRNESKYVEIYYQESARNYWDLTTLNLNLKTRMDTVSVTNLKGNYSETVTGLHYYKDRNKNGFIHEEANGSLTFTGFNFSNGFYTKENYNLDYSMFDTIDPYKNIEFDIRNLFNGVGAHKYGQQTVNVSIDENHWLLGIYDISGTVTIETITCDIGRFVDGWYPFAPGVPASTKFYYNINVDELRKLGKNVQAEDGIDCGWIWESPYTRRIHYVGIHSANLTLTLKRDENTAYYHLNEAIETPKITDDAKYEDTGETLFVYRDGFNWIQYGFVTSKKYTKTDEVIGSKRTDLSMFTQKVTNGYTANYYGPKAKAIEAYSMKDGKLAPASGNGNHPDYTSMDRFKELFAFESNGRNAAPVQTPINVTFNFNYIDHNYDKDQKLSPTNGKTSSADWWNWTGDNKDNYLKTKSEDILYDSKINLPTYGEFGSTGSNLELLHVDAPIGYTIVGWCVSKIRYYEKDYDNDKYDTIFISHNDNDENSGKLDFHGFCGIKTSDNTNGNIYVYAVYQPIEYELGFNFCNKDVDNTDIDSSLTDNLQLIYFDKNGSEVILGNTTGATMREIWGTFKYHSRISIPVIYAKTKNGVYYKVEVGMYAVENAQPLGSVTDRGNLVSDKSDSRNVWFTYLNLVDGTYNGSDNEVFNWADSDRCIYLHLDLAPQQYNFNFEGEIDNHVYNDNDLNAVDQVNNTLIQPESIVINGFNVDCIPNFDKDYNITLNPSVDLSSGSQYTISYKFLSGYKLSFNYKYNNGSSDLNIEERYEIYRDNGILKVLINGLDILEQSGYSVNVDLNNNILTLTFTALHGYFSREVTGNNNKGKFTGDISISDFNITTQPYNVTVNTIDEEDSNKNTSLENQAGGQYSLSELINEKNPKVLGLGSTVLVNLRQDLSKPINEANRWVLNEYLTGLSIKFGSNSFNIETGKSLPEINKIKKDLLDICQQISVKNGSLIKSTSDYKRLTDTSGNIIINVGEGTAGSKNHIQYLMQMMYDMDSTEYNKFISYVLYYSIYKIELASNIDGMVTKVPVYIILTNHDDYGISVGIMFNVEDCFKWYEPTNNKTTEAQDASSLAEKASVIEINITKKEYKSDVNVDFTNNGSAVNANGNVSLNWTEAYKWGAINGKPAEDLFPIKKDEQGNTTSEHDLSGSNDTTFTKFKNINPSNSLTFNLDAKNGYYFSGLEFEYNGTKYTIEFAGYEINSAENTIYPIYKFNTRYFVNDSWVENEDGKSLFTVSDINNTVILDNLYLKLMFNSIGMDENAQTLISVTFGNIKQACDITVHYGAYTLVSVDAPRPYKDTKGKDIAGVNSIGYQVSGGDITIYEQDSDLNNLSRKISTIQFSGYNVSKQNIDSNNFKIFATASNGSIFTNLNPLTDGNKDDNWVKNNNKIFFMAVNFSANANKTISVESTLTGEASYRLSVNKTNINLSNTTSSFEYISNKHLTNFSVINSVGEGRLVSYTLAPKNIETIVTSDINFGGVKYEEATGEPNNKDKIENSSGKYLNTGEFYDIGTNGQIASTGTKVNYTGENFGTETEKDYYQYGDNYYVFGNKLIVDATAVYGYKFNGITLRINYNGVNGYVSFGLDENENSNSGTVEFDAGENTGIYLGTYTITKDGDGATLTIIIENIEAELFEAKLNYQAKEFNVSYDTAQAFGSSPVNNGLNASSSENLETFESRTFVYNVRGNVDSSSKVSSSIYNGTDLKEDDDTVIYSRLGYNLIGWTFDSYFGDYTDQDNNIKYKGKYVAGQKGTVGATNLESITRYFVQFDAGKNWYDYLVTNNIFGENNENETGNITMYAVWDAKDYTINLNYSDKAVGNGSSIATKFAVTWKFDLPVTVSGFDENYLRFAGLNLQQNTLNSTYRLGYTFDGWHLSNQTLVYDGNSSEDSKILIFDYNYYTENIKGKNDSDWTEGVTGKEIDSSTHNRIVSESLLTITAHWSKNNYSIIFDLNVGVYSENNGNVSGLSLDKNSDGALNISLGNVTGLGSSAASLVRKEVIITFDQTLPTDFAVYAYRYGYKFSGWYFTRGDGSFAYVANADLAEGNQFDVDLLIRLLGETESKDTTTKDGQKITTTISAELNAIKDKYNSKSAADAQVNAIETLGTDAAKLNINGNNQAINTVGNLLLLHARWEALNYYINIDLNNWNHTDYAWDDADYMVDSNKIAGDSQNNTNIVSPNTIYYVVTFDTIFGEGKLYIGGNFIADSNNTANHTYFVNGAEYMVKGTGYEILIQILTSYGYNLGVNYGESTYHFSLQGDGVDNSIGSNNIYALNETTVFNNGFMQGMYYYNTEFAVNTNEQSIDWNSTSTLLSLDYSGTDKGDLHKEAISGIDVKDWQADDKNWGRRTFTIFALWTKKTDKVYNLDYNINYGDENAGKKTLTFIGTNTTITSTTDESDYTNYNYNADAQKLYVYSPSTIDAVSDENTGLPVNSLTYYNNADINFVAPSGQYVKELMLTFTDTNDQVMGQLRIGFAWNKINKTICIVSAEYRTFTYKLGTAANHTEDEIVSDWQKVDASIITDKSTGLSVLTISKLNYMFEGLVIETTNYKVRADSASAIETGKNVNTNYTYDTESDGYGNLDVNFVLLHLTNIKGNVYFSAINKAQTYDVDYYRYVRPTNGMQTHIDEDSESQSYGSDVWDSEFLNNWNQYQVYKTETYRYGEYANTSYSYATGFAFDSWYNYQGHLAIDNFDKYSQYGTNDTAIYTVDKSGNISYNNLYDFIGAWQVAEYTWNDEQNVYIKSNGAEFGDDKLNGRPITQDGQNSFAPYKNADGTTDKRTIYLHQYVYNNSETIKYTDYKYNRSPITANQSIVGVYNPAAINQAHYYVWSGNKYVERDVSSTEYILGKKQVASVSGVPVKVDDNSINSQNFNYLEYLMLGTNDQYYRVGFSGIENGSAAGAVAFLMQFVNPESYNRVLKKEYAQALDKQGKLTMSWDELKAIILAGITVNGINTTLKGVMLQDSTDCISLAVNLLKQMLIDGYNKYNEESSSPTDGYNINKYLSDYNVVRYMGYNDIAQDNVFASLCTALGLGNNASTNQIIYTLSLNALNVLLDSIAIDYFGFVIKNPTNTIGSWPTNTYFAGWYMVDSALRDKLISGEFDNHVLTYNDKTWDDQLIQLLNPCKIESQVTDENGDITYTIGWGKDTYQVTRFNAVNPYTGRADMLSRVNGEVFIFAAYNAQRFTMGEEGCTDADVQMGSNAEDIDGNIYQYNSGDVRYVVLDQTQFNAFMAAKANNNNNPTALRMALGVSNYSVYGNRYTEKTDADNKTTLNYSYYIGENTDPKTANPESITGSFTDAKAAAAAAKDGGYIFAFVYQVNEIEFVPITDSSGFVTANLNIYYINYIVNVASQYGYYNNGTYKVANIADYKG